MNQVFSPISVSRKEASLSRENLRTCQSADPAPVLLSELVHDLRQPLGVIESLAYYLELTSTDEKVCAHLQRIQTMISEANSILERSFAARRDLVLETVSC